MADVQWYYARNDEPMGPISASELKQLVDAGQLKPDDLLWREGMDEWTTAINLRGLFGADPPQGGKVGAGAPTAGASNEVKAAGPPRSMPPPAPGAARTRLQALVRTTQTILWSTCVLVVLVGLVLFTRALLMAKDAREEASAGAVFATFFIAAYVLARCGEKLSSLLVAHARGRGD